MYKNVVKYVCCTLNWHSYRGVFNEAYFYEIYDSAHSDNEQDRYIGFGFAKNLGLSVVQVVYTETQRIHIISTRLATEQERNFYYDRLREINR